MLKMGGEAPCESASAAKRVDERWYTGRRMMQHGGFGQKNLPLLLLKSTRELLRVGIDGDRKAPRRHTGRDGRRQREIGKWAPRGRCGAGLSGLSRESGGTSTP